MRSAIKRAVENPRRADLLAVFKGELAVQETFASIADDRRFFKSDELFHQHIASHAGFPGLWADISAAKLHMDRFRFLSFPRLDSMSVVLGQHRRIVDALEQAEALAAEEAMRMHLRRIFEVLEIVQQRYPHYFEAPTSTGKRTEAAAVGLAERQPIV
ncbi:FCD domain-containing protein [Mesorhizobium sp. M0977]|uniref:FCD domain-containing protein n=1 Tax=Mesorhizobium sp. M0977 TaxID=2957039 RepID=UPI003338076A